MERMTEQPQPWTPAVLNSVFPWTKKGRGKRRSSSYMKTEFQISIHCLNISEWLIVSRTWNPESFALSAIFLMCNLKLRWNFPSKITNHEQSKVRATWVIARAVTVVMNGIFLFRCRDSSLNLWLPLAWKQAAGKSYAWPSCLAPEECQFIWRWPRRIISFSVSSWHTIFLKPFSVVMLHTSGTWCVSKVREERVQLLDLLAKRNNLGSFPGWRGQHHC